MSNSISWTPAADLNLLQMRAAGVPWPAIGRHLHVGRSAAIERARSLGLPPKTRLLPPAPAAPVLRVDRAPLPSGHPITWGAIIAGTQAQGTPYPLPVFL